MTRAHLLLSLLTLMLFTTMLPTSSYAESFPPAPVVQPEQSNLRFVVYYTGDLEKMMTDNDNYLKTFLETYNFKLVNTFEIDEENKGFTIEIERPVFSYDFIARELSIIDEVLMVEIVLPEDVTSES